MTKQINAHGKCTEINYLWEVIIFDPEKPRTRNIVATVSNVAANCVHDAEYTAMQLATGAKYPRQVKSMHWEANQKSYETSTRRTTS